MGQQRTGLPIAIFFGIERSHSGFVRLTKMQISCKHYEACTSTILRFYSRSIGGSRPHGTLRLCGLAAAFAG